VYPISEIKVEDVALDHRTKKYGKNFSQVEAGKNWLIAELSKIVPTTTAKGWLNRAKTKRTGIEKGE